MAMSNMDIKARQVIYEDLYDKGFATYAEILMDYHLNRVQDPSILGYMVPAKGLIVVNSTLEMEEVELIIRHEIMHFYLKHAMRLRTKLMKEKGISKDTASKITLDELEQEVFSQDANIVMDYEISNLIYDDDDKNIVRVLHALVTEDDHPGWETMTMEQMWDELKKWRLNHPPVIEGVFISEDMFAGMDGTMYTNL